jgi:hypothetical protein
VSSSICSTRSTTPDIDKTVRTLASSTMAAMRWAGKLKFIGTYAAPIFRTARIAA